MVADYTNEEKKKLVGSLYSMIWTCIVDPGIYERGSGSDPRRRKYGAGASCGIEQSIEEDGKCRILKSKSGTLSQKAL